MNWYFALALIQSSANLVDRHPARQLGLDVAEADRVGVGLLLLIGALLEQVGLEAGAKVVHADEGVDDGQDDEQDGQHREGRQGAAHGDVVVPEAGLVDADELEEEVGEAAKVEGDDGDHAGFDLTAGEEGGEQQDGDGDGDGGDGQAQLEVRLARHDDEELDREAEEEEEIELKESDVDLEVLVLEKNASKYYGDHHTFIYIPGSARSGSSCGSRRRSA